MTTDSPTGVPDRAEAPGDAKPDADDTVLVADDVTVEYPTSGRAGPLRAVAGVSLRLYAGQTVALVGESGCGKSSFAQAAAGMLEPADGTIELRHLHTTPDDRGRPRHRRLAVQLVFQDPTSAMNERFKVLDVICEPWRINRDLVPRNRWRSEAIGLLELVGLSESHLDRYPHQLSGGQRQRVIVARALAVNPRVLILDEPVSALDVSVQAQVINLFQDLQRDMDLAYLFISHDLAVVRQMADHVAVMYLGKIVEYGRADDVYADPRHPYTVALLSAIPSVGEHRNRIVLEGELPNPQSPPSGCRFRTRCWRAEQRCVDEEPALEVRSDGHLSACHFADDMRVEMVERP